MEDAFDTVAITWSQPEAAVMLSFLEWHGIPAYALGRHAQVEPHLAVALGGVRIRVHRPALAEARALLAAVPGPPVVRPATIKNRAANVALLLLCGLLLGIVPPPRTRSILL